MTKKHIIVVDDEEDILQLLNFTLTKEGYRVTSFTSGDKVLKAVEKDPPDLVLLDLMLPGIDGMELCRRIKNNPATRPIPVIMLTAKSDETDVVSGLELGAEDYIPKPFSPKVLIARVRTVLRRGVSEDDAAPGSEIKIHDIVIHEGRREVLVKGKVVDLTYSEFQILTVLAKKPGWVFSRYQIVDEVRGDDYPVTERSIDVQIVGLRKKLGASGKYVETVRGVGYRMKG